MTNEGDEMVVSIAGYPVGKGIVMEIKDNVVVRLEDEAGTATFFRLPIDFDYYNAPAEPVVEPSLGDLPGDADEPVQE